MLYIIGLGLDIDGISKQGLEAIKKSNKIYLEGYTVDFPYSLEELEKELEVKIIKLTREDVESLRLVNEAKKENVTLLVYGCPLFATTHTSLLLDCKKNKVKFKIIYSASVFDAIAETGLQLYKFGKITSMPAWNEKINYKPDSFMDVVKENSGIKAHTLILCDIGLGFSNALKQLETASENKKIKLDKIVVCSNMGTDSSKILYDSIENLKKEKIKLPFCIVIPAELHFAESEFLNGM